VLGSNSLNIMRRLPIPQPLRAAGLTLAIASLAACGGHSSNVAPADPEGAIRAFLNAVKANSLTGMAERWGTDKGPASQSMNQQELDKRLTVMRSFLVHDSFEFQPRNTMDATGANQRVLDVRITRGNCQPVVPFTVVRWGSGWLVYAIDLGAAGNPARPCDASGTTGPTKPGT